MIDSIYRLSAEDCMLDRFRKDKSGASLVFVIVTFSIASILVVLVLMMSLSGIKMRIVDANAKNSFNSCEGVMSQVKAGLQNVISKAYSDSYIDVMQKYTSLNENERRTQFENDYIDGLRNSLRTSGSNSYYDVELLKSFVTTPLKTEESGYGAEVTTVYKQSGGTAYGLNKMSPVGDKSTGTLLRGLVLKDVVVKYTDRKGDFSQIQTDIILKCPNVDFTQTSEMPNLLDFTIVAQDSLTCAPSSNSFTSGDIYGGRNGIVVSDGASYDMRNAAVAVTDSTLTVSNKSKFTTDSMANFWANSVNVVSSALSLKGSTYLSDDLIINDIAGAESSISISGNYFGYGNPDTAKKSAMERLGKETGRDELVADIAKNPDSYSSSIAVNGTHVTMDFSGINYLMLSGNSYIGAKLKSTDTVKNSSDVMTGESITVKSNQLVYLVPAELIGKGYEHGGRNPMTLTDYAALRSEAKLNEGDSNDSIVDLSPLGSSASGYQTVFYPAYGTSTVYFYLSFDSSAQASQYFKNYCSDVSSKSSLDKYASFYLDGIKSATGTDVKFDLNGSIMESFSGDISTIKSDTATDGTSSGSASADVLTERQVSLQDKFAAYRLKLVPSYNNLSESERTGTVFTNLVYKTQMENALRGHDFLLFSTDITKLCGIMSTKDVIIKSGDHAPEVDGSNVVVYTGEGTDASPYLRCVITTGSVTVDACSFDGLILSNSSVTLKNGASCMSVPEDVAKVIEASRSDGTKMMDYIINSLSYIIGVATSGSVGTSDSSNVKDLVVYENWVKQ